MGTVDLSFAGTFKLNEKSDVYSFRVVLLELITGLPAVVKIPERGHIAQWVRQRLARGDITDVVSAGLKGEYDTNSVWNVVDTTMKCTMPTASQRPAMSEVVSQLKESLQLELSHERAENIYERAQNIYVEALELDQIDLFGMAHTDAKITESGPTAR
ncbi:LRR receptor-like serine/threonine-protein kinase IOS1 [Elaeis guineensis]|uniref:LRR receptor-like serine/threonine-protein kinase IOS1 n=1 Tax=Elaeis guineensis var. tenera TaxID=51953 RepID=UPI003C6CE23C